MVSLSELNVGDESTFGDLSYRKNISNLKRGCFTAEDGLSSEHSLNSKVVLNYLSIVVWILKLDLGNWSSSAWIVEYLLYNSLGISVSFLVVQVLVTGLAESSVGVGLEDGVWSSLSL